MTTPLHVYRREQIDLASAIEVLGAWVGDIRKQGAEGGKLGDGQLRPIALLYTPQNCQLAVLEENQLKDAKGRLVPLTAVFEARVFCDVAELRWLHDPNGGASHAAVILCEKPPPLTSDWTALPVPEVIDTIPQTYLLWGEGTGRHPAPGWSELATARIGAMPVPVGGVEANARVVLHSKEYVVEAEHGNAVVYDERLLRLEKVHG
ncbi:MAG: hypothetical protein KatS3mg110_0507 [Pirellulaceae bacterium]|nr:MAG: hypothetical protein KatS3mg110_0507 [Pirellulaceae bacterium]